MYSHDIETKQKVTVQLISIHQEKKLQHTPKENKLNSL